MVERVVNNGSLFLEWILGVNRISTSTSKTTANNGSNDDTNENTSTDGGGDGSGAGEEARTCLYIVSASLVCALILVTGSALVVVIVIIVVVVLVVVGISSDARSLYVSIGVLAVIEQASFGVIADLDVVLATKCGIASVNSTIVAVIAVNRCV